MTKRGFLLVGTMLMFALLSACNNVNYGSVREANLYQDENSIFKFTDNEHAEEIRVLVKVINKVRSQAGMVDMPRSDYQLEFVLDDGEARGYSVWIDPDSSFVMENSTSYYVELSSSDTEKLNQVITEFDASGIKHFNFYYLVMLIPVLVVIPIVFDILRKRRTTR
jgi:hypothetical protein